MKKKIDIFSKSNFLKLVPIFSSLASKELEEISEIANIKTYKKNSLFFLKDDLGIYLFIIKSGSCKVVVEHEDGREIILSILYPKDIFGEMSLLDGKPRSATVIAREDCEVLTLTRTKFLNFLKNNPNVSIKILETISKRLRKTDEQVKILTFVYADCRVAQLLLSLSDEYGVKRKDGIFLDLKLTHQDIGDMCGIRRETANRVIMEFARKGAIKREGKKLLIINKSALYEKIHEEEKNND